MEGEKRAHDNALIEARWAGVFAQAAPKEHDRMLKRLLAGKPAPRAMSGAEIGQAMRAWVGATRQSV